MIATCEKCRKRYEVDLEKFEGEVSRFRCTSCGNVITVSKPKAKTLSPSPLKTKGEKAPGPELESFGLKRRKIGLRGKIFLILFIIPIFIFLLVLAVPFTVGYFNKAVGLIVDENVQYAVERSKSEINQMATSVAGQVEQYLFYHPELKREDLTNDPGLRKIILQRVSFPGEASLYLRFDPETREPLGTFVINHNKDLEGQPLSSIMVKGTLGKDKYDQFGKVVRVGDGQYREASDFYLSRNAGGILKERILACSPVAQTPYGIVATADTDDFMASAKLLEGRVKNLLFDTRNILIGIFGGTILLIGLIILLYVHSVTSKIRSLTEVAYRISVGELGAQIEIKSNDEIGDLAEAISRMQDSIRLSIERLRRRAT